MGAPRPDVSAGDGSEQPAPLADATLSQIEDVEQLAGEEPEVLPDIKDAGAGETQHHHPCHAVSSVAGVDVVFGQQPDPESCRREDAEHAEDAVPRDEKRAEPEDVGLEVDDDGEEHHECAARLSLASATSFGSSASV